MKSISKVLMVIAVLLSAISSFAQIKNVKTETVKIYGNCEMCKKTIENAGTVKNVATVEWNKDTKMATLTYDDKKTSQNEILERIARAGYDSKEFLAPDDVYAKLPECCKYKRELHPGITIKQASKGMDMNMDHSQKTPAGEEHSNHSGMNMENAPSTKNADQLQPLFNSYFDLKDALVKTDAGTAAAKAKELLSAIKAVEMGKLEKEQHNTWMKVMKDLETGTQAVSQTKDIEKQRKSFAMLSEKMYLLAKVFKLSGTVYYQHCPMYNNGSNWLSKSKEISNPFYGNKMLTCGSTTETLSVK